MNRDSVVLYDPRVEKWLKFEDPVEVISCCELSEVLPALERIEERVETESLYAAGFISYEASPAFDESFRVNPASDFPFLWFGLYHNPEEVTLPRSGVDLPEISWQPSVSRDAYDRALAKVKEHIAAGNTYQVNYTLRLSAPVGTDPFEFFLELTRNHRNEYAAFVETSSFAICSMSPELFFTLDGDLLSSRPMKGTAARGVTLSRDREQADWLYNSVKNRAENVMIVDMIRNDMGRVAETGSVHVPKLFDIETYPTVLQMTTTVAAKTKASVSEILKALFPCSSITGAPKTSTMGIIADLEGTPRNIYTGSIGTIFPGRRSQFNVAIRTVLMDKRESRAEYGVGGGIVWDSDTSEEFEECRIKARVLTEKKASWRVLESLLWTRDEGFFLLDYHMDRMGESCEYFCYPFSRKRVVSELERIAKGFAGKCYKVRILLERTGGISCEGAEISLEPGESGGCVSVGLAGEPVSSGYPFLYHKTTLRSVYEDALSRSKGCDEVILFNERGEVTEATTCNVVVRMGDDLVTPPVSSGLLAGTFRRHLLETGEIVEGIVTLEDIKNSREVYLINSVRRWRRAKFVGDQDL